MFSSDERERARFVEKVVADSLDFLSHNESVRAHMGVVATQQAAILEASFIPNLRHGVISIPRRYMNTSRTPIVALRIGEQLKVNPGSAVPNSYQLERVRAAVQEWDPGMHSIGVRSLQRSIYRGFVADPSPKPIFQRGNLINPGVVGQVELGATALIGGGRVDARYLGRPFLGLLLTKEPTSLYLPVVPHELTHVEQINQYPIQSIDNVTYLDAMFRWELEAYHYGALFENGLYHSDDPRFSHNAAVLTTNTRIDNVRLRHQDHDDPFKVTETLKAELASMGLDIAPPVPGL
jgi:hypothetical protein